jgi:hypothetical protein
VLSETGERQCPWDSCESAVKTFGLRRAHTNSHNEQHVQHKKLVWSGSETASAMRRLPLIIIASSVFGVAGFSQDPDPAVWQSKLTCHALEANGHDALAESAFSDGYCHLTNLPGELGQGGGGYSTRVTPTLAYSALGFGPDTVLTQDPRYRRSGDSGLWRRTKNAIRATISTRTDSGGETLATWHFGSAYGASLLSNEWYPDRLNPTKVGLEQGSAQIAFDLHVNFRSEFWIDVKNKILRRKP